MAQLAPGTRLQDDSTQGGITRMGKSSLSALLTGALIFVAGVPGASAGVFSFFHHSDCGCEQSCNTCGCECEREHEHCCCLCPPCPPEGTIAFSVAVELNQENPFLFRDLRRLSAQE